MSVSESALKNNYHKPEIVEENIIDIKAGRHPVIEQELQTGEGYIPNDIFLDTEEQQVIMITGPNMAGNLSLLSQKSFIRL